MDKQYNEPRSSPQARIVLSFEIVNFPIEEVVNVPFWYNLPTKVSEYPKDGIFNISSGVITVVLPFEVTFRDMFPHPTTFAVSLVPISTFADDSESYASKMLL